MPPAMSGGTTPCARCGYRLLIDQPRCPECGTWVSSSPLLRHADPEWLARLSLGGRLAHIGGVVALLGILFGRLAGAWIRDQIPIVWPVEPSVLLRYATVAAMATAIAGAWLIASPDPGEADDAEDRRRRMLSRATLVIALTAAGARLVLDRWLPAPLAVALTIIAIICLVVAVRRLGAVVRSLASRCRDADASAFERAGRGGGCTLAIMVVTAGFWISALLLAAGGGRAAAVTRSGEMVLVLLGFLSVALGIASLGRPMAAVRTELAMAKMLSRR